MKVLTLFSLLALTQALPIAPAKRQSGLFGGLGSLFGGGGGARGASGQTCLVYARGSTEISPMGYLVGPGLQYSLKRQIPNLQTFPVLYAASLLTNVSPARTDRASMNEGVKAFQKAEDAGCSTIVAGGYSQGAAVMHNVIQKMLSPSIKQKIAGVALFGDTRNYQDSAHILNFPRERSRVWCNSGDGVCNGALNVNAAHLAYGAGTTSEAATWLLGRISSMGRG